MTAPANGRLFFTAQCPHCGLYCRDEGHLNQHLAIHRLPVAHECPNCPDGGLTCVYDAHPDGTPRQRICLKCKTLSRITHEAFTTIAS